MKRMMIVFFVGGLFVSLSLAQRSREINKTLPLAKDGRVAIDTYKGSISVGTWDRNEVEVRARIEPDDSWFDGSDEDVRDTDIQIVGREKEVRIKTDYDNLRRHRSGFWGIFNDEGISLPFVHYTIQMPRSARLKVKDYKSKSKIADLQSDISFNTYKGDVEISHLTGALDLETYKGEVRVDFSKLGGDSRFETYKGDIEIVLPKNAGFTLESDLGRKTEFNTDYDAARIASRSRRRDYEHHNAINGGGPTLFLKSTKGTFRLRQS